VGFDVDFDDASPVSVLGTNQSLVKSIITQGAASEYFSGLGWIGSLQDISPRRLYKVFSPSGGVLHVTGVRPMVVDYALNNGWTWIGIPMSTATIPISEFLPGVWEANDRILSSSNYGGAFTLDGVNWIGPLQVLRRGVGYKVFKSTSGSFSYTV
jgi:hypothetical protein